MAKNGFFQIMLIYLFEGLSSTIEQAFTLILLSLPQFTHNVLDGFI